MNLTEMLAKWNELGSWNQVGIASGVISVVLAVLALLGMQRQLIILSYLILFCGFWFLVYGTIQQSKKLSEANDKISNVDDRINQDVASVYAQKNGEIEKLEKETHNP
jgi:hypothetical protein